MSGPWNPNTKPKSSRELGYVIEGDYAIPLDKKGRKIDSQRQYILRASDNLEPLDDE